MKGKLIVFEGIDGSGKSSQSRLFFRRLRKKNVPGVFMAFPRYKTFFGSLISKYLNGGFGNPYRMAPEVCMMLYSIDKYSASAKIRKELEAGKMVVLDRFVASNLAYQSAKYTDEKKQAEFIEWAKNVEGRFPKPDLTVLLDVPASMSRKLMKDKKKDLHELNFSYMERVRRIYLRLAEKENWLVVDCMESGKKIKSIAEVSDEVWKKISAKIKIK